MSKSARILLAGVCFALIGTACGGDGPVHTPTAPSVDEPASAPTFQPRPVNASFNGAFWRQLLYNGLTRQVSIGDGYSYVLNTSSPNFYIRMGDPTGRRVVSYQQRDAMRRAIPRLAKQLTGQPYHGRIEEGIGDRSRNGWITVRFVTYEEEPEISEGACGRASVGADPGNIWIIRRARGNKRCVDPHWFPELFAHEFGHAMGFWHVNKSGSVMEPGVWNGKATFSAREQYHGRLAYEVGRGEYYCGWPFKATCERRGALGVRGVAPIVID